MKYIVLMLLLLSGCADEARPLTAAQKEDIASNIRAFGVVNVSGEPAGFHGPASAYLVGGVIQMASIEELPGKVKYAGCSACHGANGGGGVGPALSGKSVEYIVGRLNSYKAGETVGSQSNLMWGQAANLSDTDIKDLAEYLNTL